MRLIVLDTNVVISAGIGRPGPPAKIIDEWVLGGRVQVLTCPRILREYRDVASRDKLHRYGFPPRWLDYMIAESLHLPDPPNWPHSLPDATASLFCPPRTISRTWNKSDLPSR
jgi:hypothetical protein